MDNMNTGARTTQYWGFRELTREETDAISGGDAYADCIADGDGVSDCIPTVEVVGERGRFTIDWAYDVPIPVSFQFASAPSTVVGMPATTPEQQEEFCDYLAQKTWERLLQMKQTKEIPSIAFLAITEARVKAEAKRICLASFKK